MKTKVKSKLLGKTIDILRSVGQNGTADELQFGKVDDDEKDDQRCRICYEPVAGDRAHRCWVGLDAE